MGQVTAMSSEKSSGAGFLQTFFTGFLIVLVSLTVAGAVLATWVHYTALDTARFVDTVAPLARNAAVDKAVSQQAIKVLFEKYDLTTRIEKEIKKLPEPLKSQAGMVASGARDLAGTLTAEILKSGAFQAVWKGILTTAHSEAVKGIRASGPVHLNEQGQVILDVSALITDVKDRLANNGLGFLKDQSIPGGLGRIVLYQNSQLGNVKQTVTVLDQLFLVLPWSVVFLLILAASVSSDTRRAVIWASVGMIVALAALVIILKVVQYHYINPISNATNRSAALVVATRVQGSLYRTAIGLIILSFLTVIASIVAGPYRWSAGMHDAMSLEAFKKKRHPDATVEPGFFNRFAWPLRVGGFCLAILLMLFLPWKGAAVVAVICVAYLLFLGAIEFLR